MEVEHARLGVQEVLGLKRGRLSVGVLASVAGWLLPGFVADYRRAYPGVEIALYEDGGSGRIEDMVHAGELDLGIVRLPKHRVDLEQKFLLRERMVAVMAADHRLARRHAVAMAELAEEPFVAMKTGHGLSELLHRLARQAGFEPMVVFETGQISSMVGLVRAGIGLTVMPEIAAGSEGVRIPVRDREAYRELGVVWRQGQPVAPATGAFLEMLRGAPAADHSRT
jgi:DNA-binding transcriptional LysR family regulator